MLLWRAAVPKKTLPVSYEPNMSRWRILKSFYRTSCTRSLLCLLHYLTQGSRTQHVKGEAVQEHRSWCHKLPQLQKTPGVSVSMPCLHSELSRFSCTFLINTLLFILMSMLTGVSGNASNTSFRSGIRLSVPSHWPSGETRNLSLLQALLTNPR